MQRSFFKQPVFLTLVVLALSSLFSFAKPGADHYEIYLNNKLILKQFVHQSLSLKALSLGSATAKDQLTIYYSHCGTIGKGRSITLKDNNGNTLKKWNFEDANGTDKGMTIAVKELLQLEKANANAILSLHYAARELPKGRMLTALQFTQKNTAYQPANETVPVFTAGNLLRICM